MSAPLSASGAGEARSPRWVAVTGASGNLGRATVESLAEAGARCVLIDRSQDALASAYPSAHQHRLLPLDLGDEAVVRTAFDGLGHDGLELSGLVCTVGGYVGGTPVDASGWDVFEKMYALNVKTALVCARAVLPHFERRGGGAIVNVASMAALAGNAGESAYAAAKAGLLRLTESLAAEQKAKGVRVNAVLPGTIDTPQNRSWMSAEDAAKAVPPRAIADVIAFLLSDAARAVTGTAIKVTGKQ